jgi:hypothetical protein
LTQKIDIILSPTNFGPHIAAIIPAQVLERLLECPDAVLTFSTICFPKHEHADQPHPLDLLRMRGERPCRRQNGNSFNEGASSHRRPQGSGLCGKCFGVMRLHQEFAVGGMGFRERFAPHQSRAADVRFGSKADIAAPPTNVRFTPKSGHCGARLACPLCANSGHSATCSAGKLFET